MNTRLKSDSIITEISQKQSQIISVIRIVAMMFIVLCHYVQWFDNIRFLGEVFNVGTTMFFILSGFLYGQKDVKNIWDWYKNRIIKIVTPLYVYYILTGVVLCLINKLGD